MKHYLTHFRAGLATLLIATTASLTYSKLMACTVTKHKKDTVVGGGKCQGTTIRTDPCDGSYSEYTIPGAPYCGDAESGLDDCKATQTISQVTEYVYPCTINPNTGLCDRSSTSSFDQPRTVTVDGKLAVGAVCPSPTPNNPGS